MTVGLFGSMPADLSLVLTYGVMFLSKAFFHSSRVGLTPKRVFFLVVAKGIVTVPGCLIGQAEHPQWHCGGSGWPGYSWGSGIVGSVDESGVVVGEGKLHGLAINLTLLH